MVCGFLLRVVLLLALVSVEGFAGEAPERTSVFNERWLDAVVSIELTSEAGGPRPIGTGFLLETQRQHILLVTAKHLILESTGVAKVGLAYRLNETGGISTLVADEALQKEGLGKWFISEKEDVACRFLAWRETSKIATIPLDTLLPQSKLQPGAQLVILGFPLGLRSPNHANPIARRGIVARSDSTQLIADAFVFPGNSGGPVIYLPVIRVGPALKSPLINEEKLVGLVSSYIPYQETAISTQTLRPRIVFEENSGLANLVSADAISRLVSRDDVRKLDMELPEK
jgi:hypothetical protein